MNKKFKKIKLELFYLRKAFFQYKAGFTYLYNKYIVAPRILKSNKVFEKPITEPNLSMHVLTCHRDMAMTIWSLASYYHASRLIGKLYIHDDGSLTAKDQALCKKFFPDVEIVSTRDFVASHQRALSAFPIVKKFRSSYTQFSLKKIIDPYFVSSARFKLIIDSDVLWFQNPNEFLEIIKGKNNSYMQANNVLISVVLNGNQMLDEQFCGYNAGIIFYASENFNINLFEELLDKVDVTKERNLHFLDQIGYPYALQSLESFPEERYTIRGRLNDSVVAKHYTSPRRPLFYIEGLPALKKILFN